jgi:hypothetical protein
MVKQKLIIFLGLLLLTVTIYGQQAPIDVTDQTIKLGNKREEILYFGFAAGDKIIFSFQEVMLSARILSFQE